MNDVKSASEIGVLVKQLNSCNQTYVLNTIDLLLFRQDNEREDHNKKKGSTDN